MAIASKNANKHNLKNALDMKINKHQCGSQYMEHGQIITTCCTKSQHAT